MTANLLIVEGRVAEANHHAAGFADPPFRRSLPSGPAISGREISRDRGATDCPGHRAS